MILLLALGLLLPVASVANGDITALPVATRATPLRLLAFCRENRLLRPICPSEIPAGGLARAAAQGYYCEARNAGYATPRQIGVLFAAGRCVFAEWSYENGQGLRAFTAGRQLSGWDGRRWVADEWSMLPPPLHVGIEIQASVGSPANLQLAGAGAPLRVHALSDALFDPARNRAVALGWVTWRGIRGQLVLTPRGPCEIGDQLVFYLPPNAYRVSYAITLDTWMSAIRLTGPKFELVSRVQPGPALPRAIATLKRVVESMPAADLKPRRRGQP